MKADGRERNDRKENGGGFMKKTMTLCMIFFCAAALAACTGNADNTNIVNSSETAVETASEENPEDHFNDIKKTVDNKASWIQEYEYPSEFSMGDNLKTAVIQLALCYDNFDKDSVCSEEWKEIFVSRFIQNTRSSFEYLDMVSGKNDGQIGVDELNYIQYSLTGIELDFFSFAGDGLNRYDAASPLSYGAITGYDYEYTDQRVIVTADFEVGYDGADAKQEREITVELVKNPYSCFDGYSVVSISSKVIMTSCAMQEGSSYVFYGTDMMEEDQGVFPFEFSYSEDDLLYGHFVYVDMTQAPELAEFVRKNAGGDFKITFIWDGEEMERIERVMPVDITLDDKEWLPM